MNLGCVNRKAVLEDIKAVQFYLPVPRKENRCCMNNWKTQNLKDLMLGNNSNFDHISDLFWAVNSSDFFHHFSCPLSSGGRSVCLSFPSEFTPAFLF